MLTTDEVIMNILTSAKNDGNRLLSYFKIGYASNQIAEESNSVFIATVDTEANEVGYDYQTFVDKVEILIVTKNKDYQKAISIIKTVSREIIRLINQNQSLFDNKPIIERVTPEYNKDYVLTRGHILVQVKTKPENFDEDEEMYRVCQLLTEDMEIELK